MTNKDWENQIVREHINIARVPRNKHMSIQKYEDLFHRLRRFASSKASKKARFKRKVSRWRDNFFGKQ